MRELPRNFPKKFDHSLMPSSSSGVGDMAAVRRELPSGTGLAAIISKPVTAAVSFHGRRQEWVAFRVSHGQRPEALITHEADLVSVLRGTTGKIILENMLVLFARENSWLLLRLSNPSHDTDYCLEWATLPMTSTQRSVTHSKNIFKNVLHLVYNKCINVNWFYGLS